MSSRLATALLLALVLPVTGCITIPVSERDFLFPDAPTHGFDELVPFHQIHDLELERSDGTVLGGHAIQRPGADAVVLFFGGNMYRTRREAPWVAHSFAPLSVDVITFDHRGYGRSDGQPDMENLRADAVALVEFARDWADDRPLIIHGHSLGSFIAAAAVAELDAPPEGLVLEATAPDAAAVMRAGVPLLARPFIRIQPSEGMRAVDNRPAVVDREQPLLVLAGGQDRQFAPRLGRELAELAPGEAVRFVEIERAGHNNIRRHPEFRESYRWLLAELAGD